MEVLLEISGSQPFLECSTTNMDLHRKLRTQHKVRPHYDKEDCEKDDLTNVTEKMETWWNRLIKRLIYEF